jgi:hypothetical protein
LIAPMQDVEHRRRLNYQGAGSAVAPPPNRQETGSGVCASTRRRSAVTLETEAQPA